MWYLHLLSYSYLFVRRWDEKLRREYENLQRTRYAYIERNVHQNL